MSRTLELMGTLVAATPQIVVAALYGGLIGIVAYYLIKWTLIFSVFCRRRVLLNRKIRRLLA